MASDGYTDDPSIEDCDGLWRRIPPRHFVLDENRGGYRPSSAAFEDHPSGTPMSIHVAKDALAEGHAPEDVLRGHEGFALAEFTAGTAREADQGVAREPLPDQIAHGVVFGKKTKGVKRRLGRASEWVVPPPRPRNDS
ncbi:MAG: hypothetical protein ACLF0P_14220 [Thermoanaerobaculia bacterium]